MTPAKRPMTPSEAAAAFLLAAALCTPQRKEA